MRTMRLSNHIIASASLGVVFLVALTEGFVLNFCVERRQRLLAKVDRPTPLNEQKEESSFYKGGNAKYGKKPVVEPAKLGTEEGDEECEEIMIDFATGDELCWNEAPKHPRNVVSGRNKNDETKDDWVTRSFSSPDVADDYHKGGNAAFSPSGNPSRLEEDDDCETPFIDFVSGDELCWNDYDDSRI